jgi:hypothetical protein
MSKRKAQSATRSHKGQQQSSQPPKRSPPSGGESARAWIIAWGVPTSLIAIGIGAAMSATYLFWYGIM